MPRRRVQTRWRKRRFSGTSLTERVLILLVIAVVIGITIGIWLPQVSQPIGEITGEYVATGPASDALDALSVDDNPSKAGYDRDLFGYRQTDSDGNGCDVREDVLARDLSNVTYTVAGGCKVASGILQDPYTGKTINFVRGPQTSAAVQIDHVVALENAWQSGARNWDSAKRYRFGNDMNNLLAVDGPANQEKGSASAAYWLPTNSAYRCTYVAKQIAVKSTYSLTVTTAEKRAMKSVLRSCPAQQLP
ncbi:HNH endonuclease family protein [Bifidobacterium tsurumiense]|uniref:Extracellular deoxyribonuclease n=1 Tax=Bifidobacterium tsurumiense TaxID=356829 RepID=A0A087EK74_9BIFI|nr:HNH endonuclease family protein [Bifidobacterium tsurumiense]KFJ08175.1 extracellular deoxyribonuclease [Bifidobacterium tsurumiense]